MSKVEITCPDNDTCQLVLLDIKKRLSLTDVKVNGNQITIMSNDEPVMRTMDYLTEKYSIMYSSGQATTAKVISEGLDTLFGEDLLPDIDEAIAFKWKKGDTARYEKWLASFEKKFKRQMGKKLRDVYFKAGGQDYYALVFENGALGVKQNSAGDAEITHFAMEPFVKGPAGRWKLDHANNLVSSKGQVLNPIPNNIKSTKALMQWAELQDQNQKDAESEVPSPTAPSISDDLESLRSESSEWSEVESTKTVKNGIVISGVKPAQGIATSYSVFENSDGYTIISGRDRNQVFSKIDTVRSYLKDRLDVDASKIAGRVMSILVGRDGHPFEWGERNDNVIRTRDGDSITINSNDSSGISATLDWKGTSTNFTASTPKEVISEVSRIIGNGSTTSDAITRGISGEDSGTPDTSLSEQDMRADLDQLSLDYPNADYDSATGILEHPRYTVSIDNREYVMIDAEGNEIERTDDLTVLADEMDQYEDQPELTGTGTSADAILRGLSGVDDVVKTEGTVPAKYTAETSEDTYEYLKKYEVTTDSANDAQFSVEKGSDPHLITITAETRGYPSDAEQALNNWMRNISLDDSVTSTMDSGEGDDNQYAGDHAYAMITLTFNSEVEDSDMPPRPTSINRDTLAGKARDDLEAWLAPHVPAGWQLNTYWDGWNKTLDVFMDNRRRTYRLGDDSYKEDGKDAIDSTPIPDMLRKWSGNGVTTKGGGVNIDYTDPSRGNYLRAYASIAGS